jgi:hypothetical protein
VLVVPKAEHFGRLFRGKNRGVVEGAVHIKTHSNITIAIIICQQKLRETRCPSEMVPPKSLIIRHQKPLNQSSTQQQQKQKQTKKIQVYKTQDFNLFFSILRKRKRKRTTEKVTETKQQEERERESRKGIGKVVGFGSRRKQRKLLRDDNR